MSGKHRHPDESPEEAEAYERNEVHDGPPPWSASKSTEEQYGDDDDPKDLPSGNKLALTVLGAIVAIIAFFVAFNLGKSSQDVTASTPAPSIGMSPANPACDGLSVTYLDPHTGEDVITGGIPKDPAESKQYVADRATDPTVFQWYYNHSSLVDVLNQPKISDPWSLVTEPHKLGACWTKEGQKMYDNWKLVWMMTDAKPVPLPATGANAGVTSDGAATQSVGTIPAGTATEFTYRDANGRPVSKTLVRNECGNVVIPAPAPNVPVKPSVPQTAPPRPVAPPTVAPTTAPPPPPTTETTPPPPTTTTPPPPPPPPSKAKTPTPNPSAPPGNVPLPTFGPSHTTPTPPPSNPAPPPSSGSEQAPYVPTPTSRVIPTPEAPVATVTTTAIPSVTEAPPPPPT